MALYQRPLTAILGAINAQNNLQLVEAEYQYSNPTPYTDSTGQSNTQLTLTAIVPNSPYQGPVTVYYARQNLADLVNLLPSTLRCNALATTIDFINMLNAQFGTNFVSTDVANQPLSGLTNGAGTVTLTADPNSLGWIGTGTFQVIKGNYDLGTFVTVLSLPGLMYPEAQTAKPFGEAYSYWRDFTASEQALSAVVAGQSDLTAVAQALTAVTGVTWVLSGAARYSLDGASIVSNGPISSNATPSEFNPAFLSVMVVQLGTNCLGYAGDLIMHYSHDPEDFEDWGNGS